MDLILPSLCLLVFLLGLALFSNQARARQEVPFELKPNCLLTRYPLLFVTGPRSLFYFKSYWNLYPIFLAEHGYEVFTLHLPWSSKNERVQRLKQFISQQEELHRHFHLVIDSPTFTDFQELLRASPSSCLRSITELCGDTFSKENTSLSSPLPIPSTEIHCQEGDHPSFFLRLTYRFHKLLVRKELPSLSVLGAVKTTALTNATTLLERAQTLAEMDLRQE